ncbi:MAG: tetratricopeptide repeat protein [Akkermansiaceae bacterium]|nr:tetratricopeptide repeat protein [Akkermansiaceae bacterium]
MTHLRHLTGLVLAALLTVTSWAQTPEELARLDPAELYFQAWSLVKEGEELEKKEDFVGSFTKYRKARAFFDIIKVASPDFRKESLKFRSESTTKAMETIHEKALAQQKKRQDKNSTPLLEIPGETKPRLVVPGEIDPSGASSQKIQDLQQAITRLKSELARYPNQRDSNSARLRRQIRDLESELSRTAAIPLRDQVRELNQQIEQLRRERDAMSLARDAAVAKQARTLRRLEANQSALAAAKVEEQRLLAVIEKQTRINGRVVEGQQEQIDALKVIIKEKDALITESNKTVKDLRTQLDQSESMVTELRQERDGLIEERDQMKSLLKMNEGDRIQKLITQNVTLSKELNEAKANLDLVQKDATSSKEKILYAKQALVVAKAKIQNLQKANTQANLRMERLEKRLEQAEEDLLAQLNGGQLNRRGQEEVFMLRGVIDKLKAKVAAQQGAAKLLLDQGERMGEKDATWKAAMARINGDEKMELTIPEMELLERTIVNPNITSNIRPTREEYIEGQTRLREFKQDLNQLSRRLFAKGDFQAARGNLQLIVDEDPGAWEAMINLGIVQLRLQDQISASQQFRQSILVAGDRQVPFAHFMLGDALYRQGLYADAADEIRRSLSLDSENPKAHVLLGNIAAKTNNLNDAEFHLKEAIAQDPGIKEPYYNLSLIYLGKEQQEEAKKYYTDYLRKGGAGDSALGARLGL